MDKQKINIQIVSMRKFVKQGKVRIINRLVKQVKMLQVKHGDESQLAKYKRKIERLLSEIEALKKLHVDAVSKAALMKEKNWEEVLASKTSAMEDRALSMLANYEPVQSSVKSFYNRNEKIMPLIPELIKLWEEKKAISSEKSSKKNKAARPRSKRKGKKNNEDLELSKPKKFKDSLSSSVDEHGEENRKTGINQVKKPGFTTEEMTETDQSGSDSKSLVDNNRLSETEIVKKSNNEYSNNSFISFTNTLVENSSLKSAKQKAVTRLRIQDLEGRDTIPISESEKDESEDDDDNDGLQARELKRDPFFASGDEPFDETSDKNMSESESDSPDKNFRNKNHSQKNFEKNNSNFHTKKFNSYSGQSEGFRKQSSHDKVHKGRRFSDASSLPRKGFDKRPFKNNFSRDEGRKSFGRDFSRNSKSNSPFEQKPFRNNVQASQENGFRRSYGNKSNPEFSLNSSNSSLHPSWEAKRKLKSKEMKIAPFKGTKIKFDD